MIDASAYGVLLTTTTIGDTDQRTANKAGIYVRLVDPKTRPETMNQLMARVRQEIVSKQVPDLRIDVSQVDAFNTVEETNEANNVSSKIVRLPFRPGAQHCPRRAPPAAPG